uniref:Uncharacterized protein n=1 Tax=Oryza glumipatula TaxID=40148 RepID=A0A0E0B709_9ORYZ
MATTRATSTLTLLLLLLVSATWAASAPTTSRARNVITHVKGFQGRLPFHLETGYVEVDNTNTVELFYYFIQSERSPADDPLILWITGGPGCSALSGLLFEIVRGTAKIEGKAVSGGISGQTGIVGSRL